MHSDEGHIVAATHVFWTSHAAKYTPKFFFLISRNFYIFFQNFQRFFSKFSTIFFKIFNDFFQNFPKNFPQAHKNWFKIIQNCFLFLKFFQNFQQIFSKSSGEFLTISTKLIQNYFTKIDPNSTEIFYNVFINLGSLLKYFQHFPKNFSPSYRNWFKTT